MISLLIVAWRPSWIAATRNDIVGDFRDHHKTQIGTVVEVLTGHQTYTYEIFSVDGFGVVCPGMLTGHGSAYRLALYLSALVEGRNCLAKDFNGYQINVTVGGRQYQTLMNFMLPSR